MKATLYRIPARNILVTTDDNGNVRNIQYPATEVRAHQLAQDGGVEHLIFGRVEDLFKSKKSQPVKMA